MKEEIKLKYMIDFLENVYKDIKKQPRFEEELEKERKFINKIKGDSEDEVKELLEHIEILDNTDYILHSDKAKALLDYIENLQSQLKAKEEIISTALEVLEEKQRIYSDEQRLKQELKDVIYQRDMNCHTINNLVEQLEIYKNCVKALSGNVD